MRDNFDRNTDRPWIELILYQPQIPQNTGNIGRLCVGFDVKLSLIKPLGFELTDRNLKRAGLDYWKYLNIQVYSNFEEFYSLYRLRRIMIISKFSETPIYDFSFQYGDCLIMGNETSGFPHSLSESLVLERLGIPMNEEIRSYNLANASAMVLYETYRQLKSAR